MPNAPRRVILVSPAYLGSKRRTGFHHLAGAFWDLGWDVTFVTAPISFLSRLRRDYRFEYPVVAEANRLVAVRERLTSFVLMTRWQPGNLRTPLANRVSTRLFRRYAQIPLGPLEAVLPRPISSSSRERRRCCSCRASEGSRRVPGSSIDRRTTCDGCACTRSSARPRPRRSRRWISSASRPGTWRLRSSGTGRCTSIPPAIDKAAFDRPTSSPYEAAPAAVFAGVTRRFDYGTLALAAQVAPHVGFHVVGLPAAGAAGERLLPAGAAVRRDGSVPAARDLRAALLPARLSRVSARGTRSRSTRTAASRSSRPPSSRSTARTCACSSTAIPTASASALAEAERMPHSAAFADGVLSADELARILAGDAAIEESA